MWLESKDQQRLHQCQSLSRQQISAQVRQADLSLKATTSNRQVGIIVKAHEAQWLPKTKTCLQLTTATSTTILPSSTRS